MPTLRSHTHLQATQANAQTKACKRVCLPNRTDITTLDRRATTVKEGRTHNSGFAKKRVQCLIKHFTSHQLLCYVDSFVLRNPLLRKAANRYVTW
jgi:hypothetical protein